MTRPTIHSLVGATLLTSAVILAGCNTTNNTRDRIGDSSRSSSSSAMSGSGSATSSTSGSSQGSSRGQRSSASTTMAYPTGDAKTSAILLSKNAPSEVVLNSSYEYTIDVKNLTSMALENVVVTDAIANGFEVAATEPQATMRAGVATWTLGVLRPNSTKTIKIRGKATRPGEITSCSNVEYNSTLCAATNVVSPALKVATTAPAQGSACDPVDIKVTVSNTGTGDARNVRVSNVLPDGWTTMDGKNQYALDFGTLAGGKSADKTVRLKSVKAGRFTNKVQAVADGGLSAESLATTTTLVKPVLTVSASGPSKIFADKPMSYTFTVKNTGEGAAEDAKLVQALPAGAKFLRASDSGRASGRNVSWSLGTIAPGATKEVTATVTAASMGQFRTEARVNASCADAVTATTATNVTGIPALLLEVVDLEDPVALGEELTYVITVTNQGSAADTNIKVVCKFEEGVEYVSSGGDARGTLAGRTVTFAPIPTLAPKDEATLRLVVKGTSPADSRFGVSMTSDQKDRPIAETEATTFYQ